LGLITGKYSLFPLDFNLFICKFFSLFWLSRFASALLSALLFALLVVLSCHITYKIVKFVTSYLVIKIMICHNFIRVVINIFAQFTKASHYICRLFDDFSSCSTMQHIHSMATFSFDMERTSVFDRTIFLIILAHSFYLCTPDF
jgi:hypothetical protein